MLQPGLWGYGPSSLPHMGSSPDGLIYHPPCRACGAGAATTAASVAGPAGGEAHGAGGGCAECRGGLALPGQWEVVEVKNHCPFVGGVRCHIARLPACVLHL